MITLIGTGHIFDLSAALLSIFDEKEPEIVGVELDPQRYQAILIRNTDPASYHAAKRNLPFIYRMLAQFQESMAEQYGVNAGDEMLSADQLRPITSAPGRLHRHQRPTALHPHVEDHAVF